MLTRHTSRDTINSYSLIKPDKKYTLPLSLFYLVLTLYILALISSDNLPGQLDMDLLSVGAGGDSGGGCSQF